MIQILDKYGNTSTDDGKVIIFDKFGHVKKITSPISPSGPAGGDLSGNYPNPSVIWNNGIFTYNALYYPLLSNPSNYLVNSDLTPYLTSATAAITYYPIPTGTTSQYIRGDGSIVAFPFIPSVTPSALTKIDDTNITLTLGGSPNNALLHATSLTLGWSGTLADSRIASSSIWNAKQNALLGTGFVKISGSIISYDNSSYYLASNPNAFIALTNLFSGSGISYNNSTGVITSTITQYTDTLAKASLSFVSGSGGYNSTTGVIAIPTNNSQILNGAGYLTSNQTITLSGDVTGTGTIGVVTSILNTIVTGKLLTNYISAAGVISPTDSILSAIQKLNGNIAASVTGVSSVFGRNGAVVAIIGDYNTSLVTESTNLYYTQTRFDSAFTAKNTDNLTQGTTNKYYASSLFTADLATKTTTNLTEGVNLYYTEARVNANANVAANSAVRHNPLTLGTENGLSLSTQVLSLAVSSTTLTGALTSTDWNTFNSKESVLTFSTGLNRAGNTITNTITQYNDSLARLALSSSALGLTYTNTTGVFSLTSGYIIPSTTSYNNANWDSAYVNRITSLTTTGSGAATLTASVLNIPIPASAVFTSLTTTGNNGASTLLSGVLNVPIYTLSGLGGEPIISVGTTTQYWRGDKTFQTLITTVVTEGTNLYYTASRFNSAFSLKTTTDLIEGTNLYFTNSRAVNAMSGLYEVPLTFSIGLSRTGNTIANTITQYTDALARASISSSATGITYTASTGVFTLTSTYFIPTTATLANTNTGDNAVNSLYSGLVSNATHTGDASGATVLTLATVNSNIGTFNNVTVNAKGLVTSAFNISYLTTALATSTYFPLIGGDLTGTSGAGYHGFISQVSNPATPTTGFRFYADATNRLSWLGVNGFTRTFDGTSNTANRVYTLPDRNITFDNITNATTTNIASGFLKSNGSTIILDSSIYITSSALLTTATGDVSGTVSGTNLPLTLATVNSNVGSFGSTSLIPIVTVNAKGLITAVSTATVPTQISSLTLNTSGAIHSTPVTFTNTAGVWSGSLSLITQTANTVFAGPTTGIATTPTFRTLVTNDIPSLPWSKITSGTPTTLSGYGITDAYPLTGNPSNYISLLSLSATSPILYNNTTGVISHVSSDGNLHVPATSTTNNGKVLTAGATAGSISWATPTWGVTSVAQLTLGTTGTDLSSSVVNSTTTPVITLNVPTASASNRGVLSTTDWSTFNNKQNALSLTAGFIPKAIGASTLGDSLIQDNGATIGVGAISTLNRVTISDTVLASSGSLAGSLLNLTQTWNTSGAPTAIKLNVTNTASLTTSYLIDLQLNGSSLFRVNRQGFTEFSTLRDFNSNTIISSLSASVTGTENAFSINKSQSPISGERNMFASTATFNPASGTAIFTNFLAAPIINQTGNIATGITRGLYINPTLTAAVDFRAIEAVSGSIVLPYASATATYSIKTSDYLLNFTTGTFTATLPTAVGCTGKHYVLKNSGTGIVTIATTSSQIIDDVSTLPLNPKATITIVSTGTNWIIKVNNQGTFNSLRGTVSVAATAQTSFTVTFGGTQPNATYFVGISPLNALTAAQNYIMTKTTTSFTVTFLTGLTGTVAFDWVLHQ